MHSTCRGAQNRERGGQLPRVSRGTAVLPLVLPDLHAQLHTVGSRKDKVRFERFLRRLAAAVVAEFLFGQLHAERGSSADSDPGGD